MPNKALQVWLWDYDNKSVQLRRLFTVHAQGVVAVSCTEPYSHQERIERAGRPNSATILVWNFKDPIHPEYAFEAPFEVCCFKYNPVNPDIIAGGCYNGQVRICLVLFEQ